MYQIHSDFHIIVNVGLVKMWFINGKAFTFEEIDNPSIELIEECQNKLQYTMDDMYRISQYLIMERFLYEKNLHYRKEKSPTQPRMVVGGNSRIGGCSKNIRTI